jgi:hypothetical protein
MMAETGHLPGRRRFGWYLPKPHGGLDLHIVAKPIDEENWNEFRAYTRPVELIRPFMIDYYALASDFAAAASVEAEVGAVLTGLIADSAISIPASVDANARAQQLVSDFLGAASAFRDRAASRLSRQFGSAAGETLILKAATSRLFDKSFAYRVMYALRNYAQHHEVPISLVPINAERGPDGTMKCRIALHLDPAKLITTGKVSAKFRAELAALQDKKLALGPLIEEFMTAHQEVMIELLNIYSVSLSDLAHYAAAFYRTFEVPHDAVPVIWEGDDPKDGPHTQRRCIMCGFDEMMRALALRVELAGLTSQATYRDKADHALI